MLTVSVEGGELLGFGSVNPKTEERYHTGRFTTCQGHALAVIRVENKTTVTLTDGECTGTAMTDVQ